MRITHQQLLNLINEEISEAVLRTENRRLLEASGYAGDLYNMDVSDLLDFAEAYRSLGVSVAEQLHDILDAGEDADVNPNTVALIRERLGGLNAEIDTALDAWETSRGTD